MQGADPLHQLLHLVAGGETHTVAGLAERLDVDVALVEQMLETLERARYIESVEAACRARCEHCPTSEGCRLVLGSRMWTVTERGRRALAG